MITFQMITFDYYTGEGGVLTGRLRYQKFSENKSFQTQVLAKFAIN